MAVLSLIGQILELIEPHFFVTIQVTEKGARIAFGYRWHKTEDNGSIIVPDEPIASIIREALEGFASGRFQIQAEVKRLLESQPVFSKVQGGIVLNQTVTNLLKRSTYAGLFLKHLEYRRTAMKLAFQTRPA